MARKKSKPKGSKGGSRNQGTRPVAGEAAEGSPASPGPTEGGRNLFPIVGLGASAGGLEALQVFFDHMPSDSGMAFVVVTHQHPGHTSMMRELLSKHTAMSVQLITSGTKVEPNCVYVGPPGPNIAMLSGTLSLMERDTDTRLHLPIDYFFRSLAQDQKERAIGIILSGTGTDGTLGLKAIKGASGMAMVQEAQSAKYTGMPYSAIATDLVDYILPIEELPQQLLAYAKRVPHLAARKEEPAAPSSPEALRQVFVLLRNRTSHDFSSYKPTTIGRRIDRRMNVNQIEELEHYVRYLQANPNEIDILFKELLIGVTSFFRDSEAFDVLEKEVLPTLLADKPDDYLVRIWVPGCSTGEEAYSLAILICDYMDKHKKHFRVQIFATDLDAEAIDIARKGQYPDGIAVDVKPERLERYFVRADNAYRVRKDIREMVVFATQDLIDDPPFTKLDLLSCRNLLIYLDASLQKRLVPIFHYSLKPGGVLFLGSSESIGSSADLFESIDKKWKLYRRREVAAGTYVTEFSASSPLDGEHPQKARDAQFRDVLPRDPARNLARLANESLLKRLVPTSLLVNERGDIVHVHGRTGLYLEMSPGVQATQNIFNMAREGLAIRLGAAIREVTIEGKDVWQRGVRVKTNGDSMLIDLRVGRLTEPEPLRGLFAISFENPRPVPAKGGEEQKSDVDDKAPDLLTEIRRELQHTKESHQGTVEELEATNEELKSTNEELQSTNEELQSANEELETSKEEMQSLNEELQTVNSELQDKLGELSSTNDDMKNLLNGTDIATIFLDSDLHIKRYTEQATTVISLIPSDVGRSIGDLVSRLRYEGLVDDAKEVLRTLETRQLEVEGKNGGWFQIRILPYRTVDNRIDGLVMTFVDVSSTKRANELAESIVQTVREPLLVLDGDLRVISLNQSFRDDFALENEEVEGHRVYELSNGAWNIPELRRLLEEVLATNYKFENFEMTHDFPIVGSTSMSLNGRRLDNPEGKPARILLAFSIKQADGGTK